MVVLGGFKSFKVSFCLVCRLIGGWFQLFVGGWLCLVCKWFAGVVLLFIVLSCFSFDGSTLARFLSQLLFCFLSALFTSHLHQQKLVVPRVDSVFLLPSCLVTLHFALFVGNATCHVGQP